MRVELKAKKRAASWAVKMVALRVENLAVERVAPKAGK